MKSLLIVAHGSRRDASNKEIMTLADQVCAALQPDIALAKVAFLAFASPSISEAIATYLSAGVDEITVLPYFLSAGNHVSVDVPQAIHQALQQRPDIKVTLLPHIGAMQAITSLIIAAFNNQMAPTITNTSSS